MLELIIHLQPFVDDAVAFMELRFKAGFFKYFSLDGLRDGFSADLLAAKQAPVAFIGHFLSLEQEDALAVPYYS